jgi:hypothetical protein
MPSHGMVIQHGLVASGFLATFGPYVEATFGNKMPTLDYTAFRFFTPKSEPTLLATSFCGLF